VLKVKKYWTIMVQLLQKYADMPSISDPNSELEKLQPKKINSFKKTHYLCLENPYLFEPLTFCA
jgi:hypothetical protein